MNKNIILPILISVTQITSFGHLYYVNKYGNSHIPITLIESTILSLFNILLLMGIYFFVYRTEHKIELWIIPISLAVLMILIVLIVYLIMFVNKYN
jgi:peptidoglycan biosynthesis protein MviN/MurJ (putative lipid II flippase)